MDFASSFLVKLGCEVFRPIGGVDSSFVVNHDEASKPSGHSQRLTGATDLGLSTDVLDDGMLRTGRFRQQGR